MIYDFGIALRNIRIRPLQTLIPAIVIGLAIGLAIAVAMLADGTKEGLIKASDPFGVLVIGAKGSSQQLVLSTILLQDNPIGNIPHTIYDNLENDPRVKLAVPMAFGDNVGGARIIGTNHNLFELRSSPSAPPAFQLEEGRFFTEIAHEEETSVEAAEVADEDHAEGEEHEEGLFEAVLGSRAADQLGLDIGDRFQSTHGFGRGIESDIHTEIYTVVGILEPSNTAYDGAVFTQMESIWHAHEVEEDDPLRPFMAEQIGASDQVTAILVLPASFAAQNQIFQEFYTGTEAQVAYPGQEIVELFDLIDQAREVLNIVAYLVLGIASLTVFLAMYNATVAREQAIAIMRGLGSSRLDVFRVVLFETIFVTLFGAILGRLMGYPAALLIAQRIANESSIPVPLRVLPEWEVLLWVLPLGVGMLAGLLPALIAYRVNVVEKLFPT